MKPFVPFYLVFQLAKKSHFWKPKVSQAIPHYMKPKFRDPFDYPLRSKEEVKKTILAMPSEIPMQIVIHYFADLEGRKEAMNGKVQLLINMNDLKLTPLQKDRLIFLLGPRYKGDDILKITVKNSLSYQENIARGQEMIWELYLEAIRAPCE